MNSQTKRVEYIDIAKLLGIICVIMGHTVSSDTLVKRILYAFHMPLFFILSGMVTKPILKWNTNNLKAYVEKKLRTIILPYFIWGLIYSPLSFKSVAQIAYGTRETLILANSLTSLWFLPVTFLAVILAETVIGFLHDYKAKYWIIGASASVFLLLAFIIPHNAKYGAPFGCDIALVATAMLLLGHILRHFLDCLKKASYIIPVLLISLAVFCICVQFSTSNVGYVLMANAEYGNPLWFLLNAISGSLFVIALSFGIAQLPIHKKMLLYIGQRTLGIFVVHKPIVELGRKIATKIGLDYNHPIALVSITLCTLIISVITVYLIEKIIPEIIGLRSRKEIVYEKN